jgi:cytochrome b6-f complex iron-sulfur subunit
MSDVQEQAACTLESGHSTDAASVAAVAQDDGVTRRHLLALLGAGLVGLPWIGTGLAALANFLSVPSRAFSGATTPDEVPAGLLSDLKDGEPKSILFGDETVFVIKTGSDVKAFSGTCPHAGCLVAWHQDKKLFICPCHGGTFTTAGKCIAGPPPRGMFEHSVKVSMGRVIVGRKKDA